MSKFQQGDKVRVVSKVNAGMGITQVHEMNKHLGKVRTIQGPVYYYPIYYHPNGYRLREDPTWVFPEEVLELVEKYNMNKYQIGDRVKIVKKVPGIWMSDMSRYIDWVSRIRGISQEGNYELEGSPYYWPEEALELVGDQPPYYFKTPTVELTQAVLQRTKELGYIITGAAMDLLEKKEGFPDGATGVVLKKDGKVWLIMGNDNYEWDSLNDLFNKDYMRYSEPKPDPVFIAGYKCEYKQNDRIVQINEESWGIPFLEDLYEKMVRIKLAYEESVLLEIGCVQVSPKELKKIIEGAKQYNEIT